MTDEVAPGLGRGNLAVGDATDATDAGDVEAGLVRGEVIAAWSLVMLLGPVADLVCAHSMAGVMLDAATSGRILGWYSMAAGARTTSRVARPGRRARMLFTMLNAVSSETLTRLVSSI